MLIEGYSPAEILAIPPDLMQAWACTGEPIVLRVGKARLLSEFRMAGDRLWVEVAQVEGGGDGVLRSFRSVIDRYARTHGLRQVDWLVHAVSCARPNLRLRGILERRGFEIREVAPGVRAYMLTLYYPGGTEDAA